MAGDDDVRRVAGFSGKRYRLLEVVPTLIELLLDRNVEILATNGGLAHQEVRGHLDRIDTIDIVLVRAAGPHRDFEVRGPRRPRRQVHRQRGCDRQPAHSFLPYAHDYPLPLVSYRQLSRRRFVVDTLVNGNIER